MGSCKGQRGNHVVERGIKSASMEECLPCEMLEAVMAKLDRETLCTARLVSKTFCAAASANITSFTLWPQSQAVSLERFPRLGHVKVHHCSDDGSLAQLDPRLRAVMTHLTFTQGWDNVRMALPELPGMPNLRELDIHTLAQGDGTAALLRLTNLEVIRVRDCTPPVARAITMSTWLTSLAIDGVTGPDEGSGSADFTWLQHATNLTKLQALQVTVPHKALPLIGNLTDLTGLTLLGGYPQDTDSIAPLSRLSRLRALEIMRGLSVSDLAIACSLGSGSLATLSLRASWWASADWVSLLARQTALTHLHVGGERPCNLRHMRPLRMEMLQCLELPCLNKVDAEGLDALQRATSLTKLHIGTHHEQPDVHLHQILAKIGRLTQLRSLLLSHGAVNVNLELGLALRPLTALTMLHISGARLDNGDVQALLGLTGLQVLELYGCRLTDDMVPELSILTDLRTLHLSKCGVTSLSPAINILNPLRQARGWPPVHALCSG